ncbi:MAG: hypothetical protein J0L99_12750 [Chitinophagales bacterium]|nr:hypothetical protein [Chitinophagales bacterium]
MSILQRLFGSSGSEKQHPTVVFGRYTDAYKPSDGFDRAVALFESGEIMPAYQLFLEYLRDEQEENIQWRTEGNTLHFDFWQGSQHIYGTATPEKVRVESKVVHAGELNIGFLRRLMEYNFRLKFSRFTLDDENCLTIVFDTFTEDGSPLKLMHALRELAIHADKQDDLLLEEFRSLSPAEPRLFGELPEAEKQVKYQFIQSSIDRLADLLENGKPEAEKYPSNYAYLILALAFKLDYLVKPEGFMMDTLEKIRGIFFLKSERNAQMKISAARKEFQKLQTRDEAALAREMYRTKNTFGINPAVNHNTIVSMIDGELPKMDWPQQQGYEHLALAVPDYIVGFTLFHHTPPRPDKELLHLYLQIREQAFFQALGFEQVWHSNGVFDKKAITQEIKAIAERNRKQYPHLKPDFGLLEFENACAFFRSFLILLKNLNLSTAP